MRGYENGKGRGEYKELTVRQCSGRGAGLDELASLGIPLLRSWGLLWGLAGYPSWH